MDFTTLSVILFLAYYYWTSRHVAGPELSTRLFCATVGLLLVPVFLTALVITLICRAIAHLILTATNSKFNGLLSIGEALYERGPKGSSGIIHVTGWVRPKVQNFTSEDFVKTIQERARVALQKNKTDKTMCIVKDWCGFRYWEVKDIDLDKQVRMFSVSSVTEFRNYMTNLASQAIHGNRIWEILIGDTCINGEIPVLLRIHHNYGVAHKIRDFVYGWLSDAKARKHKKPRPPKTAVEKIYTVIKTTGYIISAVFHVLLFYPTQTIYQYLEPEDQHSLKADELTTQKYMKSTRGDLNKVLAIKDSLGVTTTDVLLVAYSKVMDDIFKKRGERVDTMRVFVPYNVSGEIIPVIVKLPIATERRWDDVVETSRRVRSRPAYFMQSLLPRFIPLLLPGPIPRWAYDSTQFSGILSNFHLSPENPESDDYVMENFIAYAPNVNDRNGFGLVVVTSAQDYFFSVTIDKSLVKNENEPQDIVDGMVNCIDEMFDNINKKK